MMKKSCKYCGFIHEVGFNCSKKPKKDYKTKNTEKDRFRSSFIWQRKRDEIKERDLYLCQVCKAEKIDGKNRYNYEDLSVHHIVPLQEDYNRRLDNDNLITLCDRHHKEADKGIIKPDYLRSLIKAR